MEESYRDRAGDASDPLKPRYRRREVMAAGAKAATAAALMPMLYAEPGLAKAAGGRSRLGLIGTDHVGLTVPNIDEAVAWFKDVMGATAPLSFGPISDPKGTLMHDLLDVNRHAVIDKITVLRIGHSANIELFQYRTPHQNHTFAKNSDWSGHHIAFYVRDIDAAAKYMQRRGVEKFLGPFPVTSGPAAGQTINYFKTPFGTYIEFISYPHGEAYRKHPGVKPLWSPKVNGLNSVVTKVPGLLGIDHIGITVPDVVAAARWFEEVLGFRNPLTFGPISDPNGTLMHDLVDVDRHAVIDQIRMVSGGAGPNVELFKYEAPDQSHRFPKNSDYAGHHIAFYVKDIKKAVAHMESKGVKKLLGPFPITIGPAAGQTINYFKTPFGTFVELISYPHGMAYERTAKIRLWDPRHNHPPR
jgi:catechol 2,3-dioxygenase-like lactoylglutathione lyase family enzyme